VLEERPGRRFLLLPPMSIWPMGTCSRPYPSILSRLHAIALPLSLALEHELGRLSGEMGRRRRAAKNNSIASYHAFCA
jgi:hypothetical protein